MRARHSMRQNFYTTPDSVYINASGSQVETSVQDEGTPTVSPFLRNGTMTNFRDIWKARKKGGSDKTR